MSWIQKLCDTYENALRLEVSSSDVPLLPVCHTTQNAHIEVTLDGNGRFLRARSLSKNEEQTIIPCTEDSDVKTGTMPPPHPLADRLQYLAGDFASYGGRVTSGFTKNGLNPHDLYIELLSTWVKNDLQPKTSSVLRYVKKDRLVKDLIAARVLPVDGSGKLIKSYDAEMKQQFPVLAILAGGELPEKALVRWAVEIPGDPHSSLATDRKLWKSWANFYTGGKEKRGMCLVTGKEALLAEKHPAKIRHGGDKAKLISSNDTFGFTFLGRFQNADQACGVSFDVTQKAHNALRWLVRRQSYRSGDPVVVSWAVSGKNVPSPLLSTQEMLERALEEFDEKDASPSQQGKQSKHNVSDVFDSGQTFALRLNKMIAGYSITLGSTDGVVVMGLDSATPGRMAITYYRELTGSEFLSRIEDWHTTLAWPQRLLTEEENANGKPVVHAAWRICAPAPREIAEVAFGRRITDKLKKATVERLLPCIVDAATVPRDLVERCVHRASNHAGLGHLDWERALGIACALFKGSHKERGYRMALEKERSSRDYLYGRLLAIAERTEEIALYFGGESRDTNAAKLMQRFADHPFSTWRIIEGCLTPYKTRLQRNEKGRAFLHRMNSLLDEVHAMFSEGDYQSDKKLSAEYLLGYHCQRLELQKKADAVSNNEHGKDENEK